MLFKDRLDAGKRLADVLYPYKGNDTVVLALPRGGTVLAAEVARRLQAPLGLVIVKKISHPLYAEYAIGAIAEGERPLYNVGETDVISSAWLQAAEIKSRNRLRQLRKLYTAGTRPIDVKEKLVIVVDDGLATGLTMEAAVQSLRHQGAEKIIVAAGVAPKRCIPILKAVADEVVIVLAPEKFTGSVGSYYHSFAQVEDQEVRKLLKEVRNEVPQTAPGGSPAANGRK